MDEEDHEHIQQLDVDIGDNFITVNITYSDDDSDMIMSPISSRSDYTHVMIVPIESPDPHHDIVLNIPILAKLVYLEHLTIKNNRSSGRVIVDTDQFCTLDDLREISLTGIHILVGTPVCMIGEPLEELYIHNCTFSLGDSYYENILEMIDDHNPNMEVVSISNTDIRGYVPDWRINNSRPRTLILTGNDQLIDNTDTLPPLVTHDWDDDTDDHVARAA